jgi:hypothetical protein
LNKVLLKSLAGAFDSFKVNIKCQIVRYDSLSNLIEVFTVNGVIGSSDGEDFTLGPGVDQLVNIFGHHSMNLTANDLVICYLIFDTVASTADGKWNILRGSNFQCTADSSSGGEYAVVDGDDYAPFRHEFEYPITREQWQSIKANPLGLIQFRMNGQAYRYGWIEDIKRPNYKNAKVVLNSTKKLNK